MLYFIGNPLNPFTLLNLTGSYENKYSKAHC